MFNFSHPIFFSKTMLIRFMMIAPGVFCILTNFHAVAFATVKQHAKVWNFTSVIRPLSKDEKLKYYLLNELKFNDDKYKFNEEAFWLGLGYQPNSDLSVWISDGYYLTKSLVTGGFYNENVIREEIDYVLINASNKLKLQLLNTTRFEERKRAFETQWSIRIRQLFTLILPFSLWENYSLLLFDESFYNLNHPKWIHSNSLLEQNRIFIGIRYQISKFVSFDAGYLNQYQMRNTDENSNVFYSSLNIR